MSTDHAPEHNYHLVDPSPWPALGALSAFVFALGGVFYMHPDLFGGGIEESTVGWGVWKLLPGLLLIIATMYYWWRDVVREAHTGFHTPVVQLGLRYGMVLFIASEVMFFAAFFWAFFDASIYFGDDIQFTRTAFTGDQWPPVGVEPFEAFDLPFLNTLILLLSGTTVTWAHQALYNGKRDQVILGLGLTVLLGILFTATQAYEYSHATFNFTDGIYSSTFYLATGFHGFHVIVGTIFLFVCFMRARKGDFTPEQHFGFEAAAWYWHFVDVVWLFLFICVYWWGG